MSQEVTVANYVQRPRRFVRGNAATFNPETKQLEDTGVPAGTPVSLAYKHTQGIAAPVWTVVHNLGFMPAGVLVKDSGGNTVVGLVDRVSDNVLTITFAAAFSGVAYVS